MQYFEDIEVGSKASFGSYEVTRDEVIAFAQKYDPQPFHLSDEAAAETHFGRLSASGWHTCAMTMSMVVENLKANTQAGLGSPGMGIFHSRMTVLNQDDKPVMTFISTGLVSTRPKA
jgi:acyl dehydratase